MNIRLTLNIKESKQKIILSPTATSSPSSVINISFTKGKMIQAMVTASVVAVLIQIPTYWQLKRHSKPVLLSLSFSAGI